MHFVRLFTLRKTSKKKKKMRKRILNRIFHFNSLYLKKELQCDSCQKFISFDRLRCMFSVDEHNLNTPQKKKIFFTTMFSLFKNISGNIFASAVRNPAFALSCNLHTSVTLHQSDDKKGPTHFLSYNKKIYPPQAENEEPRKAVSLS